VIRRTFFSSFLAGVLVLCGLAAQVGAQAGGLGQDLATVRLPLDLLELGEKARSSAPDLLTAARDLERARSDFRAKVAELSGTTVSIQVPAEANYKGAGTGVQLALQQAAGPWQAGASLGLVAGYEWDGAWKTGSALTLGVKLPLPSDADVQRRGYELDLAAAEARFRGAQRSWNLALIEGYRDVLLARYDKDIAALKVAAAQMELEGAEVRGAAGAVSAAALHTARQGVAQAEAGLAAAELRLEQALFNLGQLTGDWTRSPEGPPAADEYGVRTIERAPAAGSVDGWVQLALEQRDDVQLAEARVALARDRLHLAERRAGGTGELSGGVSLPASSSEPEKLGWYVGAAFKLPLLDASVTEEVRKAELAYEQALADRDALLARVEGDVRFAYRQVELAEAVYAQAVAAAEYAARLLETAEQAAGSGVGTPAAVLSARVTLAEAEREVMAAYFDLVVRRVTLWHLVGGDLSW